MLRDSRFALAHAYFALALMVEHRYANASTAIKQTALNSARTAIQLDSDDARCHLFLALIYTYRSEFDLALLHYERSLSLNPNDANCLCSMGWAFGLVGRADEGVELIRQAMRFDPFHPDWYWDALAITLYAAHQYEDALDANLRIAGNKSPWIFARVAACYAQMGRAEEARVQVAEVLRLKPDFQLSKADFAYKNAADIEHIFEGMRKAGLPE